MNLISSRLSKNYFSYLIIVIKNVILIKLVKLTTFGFFFVILKLLIFKFVFHAHEGT